MPDEAEAQGSKSIKDQLMKQIQETLAQEALGIYGSDPPLDSSKRQIRLLSLHDSDDINAPLTGELHAANLDHDYTALSYVWGDQYNRRPIRLNDFDTTITANLEVVLRRLRSEKKAQNIWIDAVCINQANKIEKSQQVEMMSEIYRCANIQTIIWVGESENDSDEAMKLISTATQTLFDTYDPQNPSPVWPALKQLLKRDWWKRMWVIQEAMLSPNPLLKCGTLEVPFEQIITFRNLHWDAEQAEHERFRPLRNLWRECPFETLMWSNWKQWIGVGICSWLTDVASFQCQEPKDKLFALLGLINKETREKITVDYEISDRSVLIEATRLCFLEEGLLPLQQGQIDKDPTLNLPTWCSDWNSKAGIVPLSGCGFSPYPKTTSFQAPPEKWILGGDRDRKPAFLFSENKEILYVHGFIVDVVDFVEGIGTEDVPEVPQYEGDDVLVQAESRRRRLEGTKIACLRWEKRVRETKGEAYSELDGGCGFEEAFCRTIVANRTYHKLKLEGNAKSIFDAWIGRNSSSSTTATTSNPRPSAATSEKEKEEKEEHQFRIQDYSNSVVSRCAKRAFITTKKGRFGLAPLTTKVGDLVCILYEGQVAYVFREPPVEEKGGPGTFVGDAYLHGVMEGEFFESGGAKGEDFTAFWLK